jgi:hypothetical protein
MIIIRNNFIPFKGFSAMNILGVLFVRSKAKINETTIRHEAIHTAQQYEIIALSALAALIASNFYASWWYLLIGIAMPIVIYVLAWLIALALPPYDSAYKDSPFEREAYANQHYPNYLDSRPWFAWVRYVRKS